MLCLQVVIESATSAHEYETVTVDAGSSIARDMDFDRSQTHVYVMSERKVRVFCVEDAIHSTMKRIPPGKIHVSYNR